jgi:hypothetical protein
VADRISEQTEATQSQIVNCPSFVHAMLVTTRHPLPFEQAALLKLQTQPLDSKNLMGFIDNMVNTQLTEQSKLLSLDKKADLIKQIAGLIVIKEDQKEIPITPLLAKLFVERVMREPKFNAANSSIIEIYLDYIAGLNPNDKNAANYLTPSQHLTVVKIVAKQEIGQNYQPKWIEREALTLLLTETLPLGGVDALQRLIDNQILIEQRHGSYLVRFSLDPICEYIAALAMAEQCGTNELAWQELIEETHKLGDKIFGFNVALRVVYDAYAETRHWPENHWPELNFNVG